MTEANLLASCIKWLRKSQIWHLKVHGSPMQRRGIPDLLIINDGKAYALELKTSAGKVSAAQRHEMQRLARAGATVGVVRCLDDLVRLMLFGEQPPTS